MIALLVLFGTEGTATECTNEVGNSVFTLHAKDGTPVTWSKLRPLSVVLYGVSQTSEDQALVKESLVWLDDRLGLHSNILGMTNTPAHRSWYQSRFFNSTPPVNISFVYRIQSDLLNEPSAIAATVANPNSASHPEIITGAIAIDKVAFESLSSGKKRMVLRHELGHLVGFGHDVSDVMNPVLSSVRLELGSRKVWQFRDAAISQQNPSVLDSKLRELSLPFTP